MGGRYLASTETERGAPLFLKIFVNSIPVSFNSIPLFTRGQHVYRHIFKQCLECSKTYASKKNMQLLNYEEASALLSLIASKISYWIFPVDHTRLSLIFRQKEKGWWVKCWQTLNHAGFKWKEAFKSASCDMGYFTQLEYGLCWGTFSLAIFSWKVQLQKIKYLHQYK